MNTFSIGLLMVVIASLGLSLKAIFVKLAYAAEPSLSAIDLLLPRMLLALPFFVAALFWAEYKRPLHLHLRDRVYAFGLGILGYYCAAILDFAGLTFISASLERLILYLYPALTVIMLAIAGKIPLDTKLIIALIMSYLGVVVAFQGELAITNNMLKGVLLVFGSALCFAFFMILSKKYIIKLGAIRFTAIAMIGATMTTVLHHQSVMSYDLSDLSSSIWLIGLGLAILTTVIPAFLLSGGLARIGPGLAAITSMLGPVATLFFAWMILDEPITAYHITGACLTILGILLLSKRSA